MPITLNNSNISVQYNTSSNYIIETVKSDLYVRDTVGTTSNLFAEPTVSPQVSTTEYIYPPYRYFTYNSSTGNYTVQNGSMEQGGSTSFTYNYTFNDTANTVGNNLATTSTVKNTHGMGEYSFSLGGPQTADGRSSGIFIYGLTGDYNAANNRPGVNYDNNQAALPNGPGWYVGMGWDSTHTTYNSSYYYNSSMPGAWIKIVMPREIVFSSFQILGGPQNGRSPRDFKIYGSNTNTTVFSDWTLLHTHTDYTYSGTEQTGAKVNVSNTSPFKNYLMVVSRVRRELDGGLLVFQGWYIYGKEVINAIPSGTLHKRLDFVIPNTYTLTFPVRTLVDVNNNSNLILQGQYNINVGSTTSSVLPNATNTSNMLIPLPNLTTASNISIRYHLLNPTKTPEGAQWTYSSSNTNVYHLGSVGIGTTSPEYTLDVRGNIFTSVGGYTQTGSENWIIQSDRRIKENIVKASYEKCLDNIKKIELYNFNFKENYVKTNDRNQLGFIAQEVQEVYPKAVIVKPDERIEELLTLNTTQIKYTLYGAVKSLIEKVENLEMRVDKLYKIAIPDVDIIEIFESTSNISIITSNISTSNLTTNLSK